MLFAAAVTTPAISKAAAEGQCSDVEVIFARGTMEPPGPGTVGQQFSDALTSRLGGFNRRLSGQLPCLAQLFASGRRCSRCRQQGPGHRQHLPRHQDRPRRLFAGRGDRGLHHVRQRPARLRTTRGHHRTVATQRRTARRRRHPVRQALQRVSQPDRPRRPADQHRLLYANKTLDLCTPQDPVCSSGQGFSRAAHSAYKTNGMTDQAADFAANAIHGR